MLITMLASRSSEQREELQNTYAAVIDPDQFRISSTLRCRLPDPAPNRFPCCSPGGRYPGVSRVFRPMLLETLSIIHRVRNYLGMIQLDRCLDREPRMNANSFAVIRRWLDVIAVTLVFFYVMDQVLMSAQGMPLGWNLAPQN